jgi:uncharacterized protein YecA (UPF0149 family)
VQGVSNFKAELTDAGEYIIKLKAENNQHKLNLKSMIAFVELRHKEIELCKEVMSANKSQRKRMREQDRYIEQLKKDHEARIKADKKYYDNKRTRIVREKEARINKLENDLSEMTKKYHKLFDWKYKIYKKFKKWLKKRSKRGKIRRIN